MAGGQQINSAQGFLGVLGSDVTAAPTGSAATAAAGTATSAMFLPLRSKKVGGGTAAALLTGRVAQVLPGTLTAAKQFQLVGSAITLAQGVLLFRGQVTISWDAVTTNSDGSPITDLAGYRILHGTTSGAYSDSVTLGLVTSYVWDGLLPGFTHYFVVQAFDTSNQFSGNSAEAAKAFIAVSPGGFVEAQGT